MNMYKYTNAYVMHNDASQSLQASLAGQPVRPLLGMSFILDIFLAQCNKAIALYRWIL